MTFGTTREILLKMYSCFPRYSKIYMILRIHSMRSFSICFTVSMRFYKSRNEDRECYFTSRSQGFEVYETILSVIQTYFSILKCFRLLELLSQAPRERITLLQSNTIILFSWLLPTKLDVAPLSCPESISSYLTPLSPRSPSPKGRIIDALEL